MKALYLSENGGNLTYVYGPEQRARIEKTLGYAPAEATELPENCSDVEMIFSTWGMLPLSKEEIAEKLPNLKHVFYAAGSVQYFARPFIESGVHVYSAWMANAVPVIQFAFAQIFRQTCRTAVKLKFLQSLKLGACLVEMFLLDDDLLL